MPALSADIVHLILRLSFWQDIVHARAICRAWKDVVESSSDLLFLVEIGMATQGWYGNELMSLTPDWRREYIRVQRAWRTLSFRDVAGGVQNKDEDFTLEMEDILVNGSRPYPDVSGRFSRFKLPTVPTKSINETDMTAQWQPDNIGRLISSHGLKFGASSEFIWDESLDLLLICPK